MNPFNQLEKDEYGLYIHADNYQQCRDNFIALERNNLKEKLEKIPMLIRFIFNAI